MLGRQPWGTLDALLRDAGVEPAAVLPQLRRYAELLLEWNRGYSNLISAADEARFVTRHLAESLAPARWLAQSGIEDWVDLGSGGGLPALPLALAGVGKRWTLVESRRNKTLFLRKVIEEFAMTGMAVETARLEHLVEQGGFGPFGGFTSRATLRLAPTLSVATHCIRSGGKAFLWKGTGLDEEVRHDRSAWESAWAEDGRFALQDSPVVVASFIRLP